MKKVIHYILAFIIPVTIITLIFAINRIAPFGTHPIRMYDSYYQYTGFLLNLKDFNFYSLKVGLGFNYYATAAYYLLSPFNILFLFSSIKNFDIFYMIVILLKLGLASVTMSILLNYKNYNKASLLFGIIYSMSGFMVTYYYNIMWFDGIILLPLVILGLKRLVNENKPLLYLIFLTLTLITNFYIAYMIAIMTTLFFIYLIVNCEKEKRKKAIINFIIYSLLSGLISSVVLLPAFFGLLMGKASGYKRHDFTRYDGINNNIKLFFYKLCPGTYYHGDQNNAGPMIIYSSLYIFVLFVLIIFNPKYSFKYKVSTFIFFMIFFLSFAFRFFDYAWQLFQRPVWFNSRYAFNFSFFLIYVAYDNYLNKEHIKTKDNNYAYLMLLTIIIFISSFVIRIMDINNHSQIIINIIVGVISILLLFSYFLFINKKKFNYYVLMLIVIELCVNGLLTIRHNVSPKNLTTINRYTDSLIEVIDKVPNKENYRMELTVPQTSNDGLVYNYNGVNYFNSIRNQNYVDFAEYIVEFNVNSHCNTKINYYDPLILELLNIKYLVGTTNYYQTIDSHQGKKIYDTTFESSYGYLVSNKIKDLKLNKDDLKAYKISDIINTMIGENNVYYHDIDYQKSSTKLENVEIVDNKFKLIDSKKEAYIKLKFMVNENTLFTAHKEYRGVINVKVNGKAIGDIYLYPLAKNDLVEIEVKHKANQKIELLQMHLIDIKNTNHAIETMNKHKLELTKGDSLINGTVDVKNDETLFLSLPYEKGFVIKVDGKKVPYYKVLDAFVGVDIKEGKHTISIDYVSEGFNIGLVLSISGIILSTTALILNKCYNKKEG